MDGKIVKDGVEMQGLSSRLVNVGNKGIFLGFSGVNRAPPDNILFNFNREDQGCKTAGAELVGLKLITYKYQ